MIKFRKGAYEISGCVCVYICVCVCVCVCIYIYIYLLTFGWYYQN